MNISKLNLPPQFRPYCLLMLIFLFVGGCAVHRGVKHEIREGQTLWRISKVYGVELNTLLKVNNIENPSTVRAGTEIVIPGASRVRDVPSTPRQAARRSSSSQSKPDESSESNVTSASNSGGTDQNPTSSSPTRRSERSKNPTSSADPSGSNRGNPSQYFDPVWPCDGRLASRFEKNQGPAKRGIRIHSSEGSLVKAAEEGNIKLAGSWDKMPELGKIVIIFHSHDFTTVYAHLKSLKVSEGETVNREQTIGTVGQTGEVDRSLCYFEVRYELEPRDPLIFLGEST